METNKLTWKQVQKKYGNKDIQLNLSREPFYNWKDRNIPEFTIHKTSKLVRENFMNVSEWENFYSRQRLSLFKEN